MSPIETTDNNNGSCHPSDGHVDNLLKIAGIRLDEIKPADYPNLLVFPSEWNAHHDDVHENIVFSLPDPDPKAEEGKKHKLTTYNTMGFVGIGETDLRIKSRFAKDDKHDYFLHYMLGKVFGINVVNLDTGSDSQGLRDFLPYLFPAFLRRAMAQGIFKKYQRYQYNDANVRGPVDVPRHIRRNIPFAGKITYSTREHSRDNSLTQLVRHTIGHLRTNPIGRSALVGNPDTRADVQEIENYTPSYNRNARAKIIRGNLRPVAHPYFTEWRPLQKLCLQILRREEISFGEDKDKIHGLLFDGAWLWEEYLATVLKDMGFVHAENKTRKNGIYIFTEAKDKNRYEVFPDFYKEEGGAIVIDAKYKRLDVQKIARDDMNQIITYMHVLKADNGGFVFPSEGSASGNRTGGAVAKPEPVGTLKGFGGEVLLFSVEIPQGAGTFESFKNQMKSSEEALIEALNKTPAMAA
jgi:5-methylcytosine-specific restriction endonuclease McrBC regulatory subunit McrC